MKYFKHLVLTIFILSMIVASVSAGDHSNIDGLNITTNVTQALSDAQSQNKTVMLVFSQDNCYYCDVFDSEVLSNDDVQKQLNASYIVVDVDISKQPEIASKYEVFGTPTVVFVDQNGKTIEKIEGSVPADEFLDTLKEI